jgi:site-specific DNA-methyltransferase (adenine-specific)
MKKTKTSSFGVSDRVSHDASAFYSRSLYESGFTSTASKEELSAKIPEIGTWADKIYCQSAEKMKDIPDNGVGLAFTSPPYNVGKDYEDDLSLQEYLALIENVAKEV